MESVTLRTPHDLSVDSFFEAVGMLGDVPLASVLLYISEGDKAVAEAICGECGGAARPSIHIVPDEILVGDGVGKSWAVVAYGKAVCSRISL